MSPYSFGEAGSRPDCLFSLPCMLNVLDYLRGQLPNSGEFYQVEKTQCSIATRTIPSQSFIPKETVKGYLENSAGKSFFE
jgi:hypothetical protein